MGVTEAARETRLFGGSPDFARGGMKTKELNLLLMFFNARLQGLTRIFRRAAENPRQVATALGYATAMELALYGWNQQFVNEDGKLELDHISREVRATNIILLLPETYQTSAGITRHRYLRLPKGDLARTVLNPIETGLDVAFNEGRDAVQAALDVAAAFSPLNLNLKRGEVAEDLLLGALSTLNPAIKIVGEQAANVSSFTQTPIVPRGMEEVAPAEQQRETSSPTVVALSHLPLLRNLPVTSSPLRLEQAIRTVGGGLSEQMLNIADSVQRQPARPPLEGDEEWARAKIVGPIIRRFVGTQGDQILRDKEEKFYDQYQKAREAVRTVNSVRERDEQRALEMVKDRETAILYVSNGHLQKTAQRLSQLRDMSLEIAKSKRSDDQKKRAMRVLYDERLKLLETSDQLEAAIKKEAPKVSARDFRGLPLEAALDAWERATPTERKVWRPLLERKRSLAARRPDLATRLDRALRGQQSVFRVPFSRRVEAGR